MLSQNSLAKIQFIRLKVSLKFSQTDVNGAVAPLSPVAQIEENSFHHQQQHDSMGLRSQPEDVLIRDSGKLKPNVLSN
jgi:hypothetical protein